MAYDDDLMVDRAKQVNSNLVVKLNSGSTEGTNMFTYNGSGAKTVNITASSIGAAASSHNHSAANITSGTLAVARGGTGITSNPSMLVNLGSTSAASVFAASPRPGITGTLSIAHGGTGATTAAAARSALGAAAASHTHKYAGSSSAGGAANSAVKLTTARKLNGVSFNGTADVYIPNNYFVELTNQDLNTYNTYDKCGEYYSAGGTKCTNIPSGTDHFYLRVFKAANSHIGQMLYSEGKLYTRHYNSSSWSSWVTYYSTGKKPTASEIGAAAKSHGTHVTYSTTAPKANGTASAGSASTVARSDHVHPLQTSVSGNAGSATKLATSRTIDGVSFNGSANITHYGTCSTAAATAAKVVSLPGFTLATGAKVSVKFTVANTVSSPTLNVNNTGAKPIYHMGSAIASRYLLANRIYTFIYDGTNFELIDNGNHVVAGKAPGSTLGSAATAEGQYTTASGDYSHAEGSGSASEGEVSHAEGLSTTASGYGSHAEGSNTTASGEVSHAEGSRTTASGDYSHAEGSGSASKGEVSHAEGYLTTASGEASHAEGINTTASGIASHAEGYNTTASGDYSHASGFGTEAAGALQFICGRYNKWVSSPSPALSSTGGNIFIIGKGTGNAKANAFRVATTGATYGSGSYNSSGADYAEYFEWKDKNTNNEDRVGLFVTLDEQYIRIANSEDDYILGIISGNPSVIGDSYFGDNWHGMYKTDVFGRLLTEIVHIDEYIDEDTKETVPEHDEERLILNPDWDPELEYDAREDRPEWDAVGLVGKLVVIDDGTCEVNNYCKVADNGIATKSDNTSGYRVMKRLDDTHIQILFR